MKRIVEYCKQNAPLTFLVVFLTIVPFLWLKPGEMDLGGDGTRLYFYDPVAFLKGWGFYNFLPFGKGEVDFNYFNVPFLLILAGLKKIINSPYLLITLFNCVKILVGFLAVYGIIYELLKKYSTTGHLFNKIKYASLTGALFYVFSPALILNYDRAIPTHNQVFLHPLIFYLVLKFFITKNIKFLWAILVITFIFSWNFSWVSAPALFSFFPLSILFTLLISWHIGHQKVNLRAILVFFLLYIGVHAFHLVPFVASIFTSGSNANIRVFSENNINDYLNYFYGVLSIPKVSENLLAYTGSKSFPYLSLLFPFIILGGFLLNHKKEKLLPLTGIFFLIVFFFETAKITNLGVLLYANLFHIPGFSMFRNFYGQWQFVYYFFYALLIGQATFMIFSSLNNKVVKILFVSIAGLVMVMGLPFVNGSLVKNNTINTYITMDPVYEKSMQFVKTIPFDSKLISFPFTDYGYQVFKGSNNGTYIGVSTFDVLAEKKGYGGYSDIGPFSEFFLEANKEQNYSVIRNIFQLLNIHYIFHNADPTIYDTKASGYPYSYVSQALPTTQDNYKKLIGRIGAQPVFSEGFYTIYRLEDDFILPHIYSAKQVEVWVDDPKESPYSKASLFLKQDIQEKRIAYIEKNQCNQLCNLKEFENIPTIRFKKINNAKYKIYVTNASSPYLLVFSEAFNDKWQLFLSSGYNKKSEEIKSYFNNEVIEQPHTNFLLDKDFYESFGKKTVAFNSHIVANGYANAWYISPEDLSGKDEYELTLEMVDQRSFYIYLLISFITFLGIIVWGVWLFRKE